MFYSKYNYIKFISRFVTKQLNTKNIFYLTFLFIIITGCNLKIKNPEKINFNRNIFTVDSVKLKEDTLFKIIEKFIDNERNDMTYFLFIDKISPFETIYTLQATNRGLLSEPINYIIINKTRIFLISGFEDLFDININTIENINKDTISEYAYLKRWRIKKLKDTILLDTSYSGQAFDPSYQETEIKFQKPE